VNQWAVEQGGNWPIHAGALMLRTTTLRALGGWTGIPADDELATFAALSQVTDGWYDERVTWLYRYHPKQTHRTAEAEALSETGRRIALQRAAAIAEAGVAFGPEAADGFEPPGTDVLVRTNIKDTSM
jgi:hypothetical protein